MPPQLYKDPHGLVSVDPTKTCTQANDTAAKGLLSNLRQRYHETC